MASAGEVAMGGESSSTVFSSDEEDQNSKLDEDEGGPDRDSSSISSEDSFESDFESESFTDVTPLHSISNSPLPNQPVVSKIREPFSHTDAENTRDDSSSEDESLKAQNGRASNESRNNSRGLGKVSVRRPTVKRVPIKANVLQQTSSVESIQMKSATGEVAHLTNAIRKLGLRGGGGNNNNAIPTVRSRRQREHDRRLEVENEQLLKRIIAQQSRVAELVAGTAATHHVAPSTVNRKRQQKYIHTQNIALHKRIEAARAGASMGSGSSRKSTDPPEAQRRDSR